VQVDLAAKEARTRAEEAVRTARTSAQHVASAVRPDAVVSTVAGLVSTARTQTVATIETLAVRGAEVVEELRRQPAVRKVVFRAERAVDAVEDALEEVLEETAETVAEASNEVTSIAQKTAAKAEKAIDSAEEATHEVAESAKATLESAEQPEAPKPARKRAPAKTTSAARKSAPAGTSARVTRARTAKRD
jgi:heparin binding hemagglutinin HbhA